MRLGLLLVAALAGCLSDPPADAPPSAPRVEGESEVWTAYERNAVPGPCARVADWDPDRPGPPRLRVGDTDCFALSLEAPSRIEGDVDVGLAIPAGFQLVGGAARHVGPAPAPGERVAWTAQIQAVAAGEWGVSLTIRGERETTVTGWAYVVK